METAIAARSQKTQAGPERASALLPLLAIKARKLSDQVLFVIRSCFLNLVFEQGFLEDALTLATKIIASCQSSEGTESDFEPCLVVAHHISANYFAYLGLFELATERANQAIQICNRRYCRTHPLYIELLCFMVALKFKYGGHDQVNQDQLESVITDMKRAYPTGHILYYLVDGATGIFERRKHNTFGALLLFQQAIQGYQVK